MILEEGALTERILHAHTVKCGGDASTDAHLQLLCRGCCGRSRCFRASLSRPAAARRPRRRCLCCAHRRRRSCCCGEPSGPQALTVRQSHLRHNHAAGKRCHETASDRSVTAKISQKGAPKHDAFQNPWRCKIRRRETNLCF